MCPIQEIPKCHVNSERIKELERSLNDTNCTSTKKGCISDKKTLQSFPNKILHLYKLSDKLAKSFWNSSNHFKRTIKKECVIFSICQSNIMIYYWVLKEKIFWINFNFFTNIAYSPMGITFFLLFKKKKNVRKTAFNVEPD